MILKHTKENTGIGVKKLLLTMNIFLESENFSKGTNLKDHLVPLSHLQMRKLRFNVKFSRL